MNPFTELGEVTKRYIVAKKELTALERQYSVIYARLYLDEKITSLKNEEIRKNTMLLIMEETHKELMDNLEMYRNEAREAYYLYGAYIAISQKEEVL